MCDGGEGQGRRQLQVEGVGATMGVLGGLPSHMGWLWDKRGQCDKPMPSQRAHM